MRSACTLVALLMAAGSAAAQDCEKWEWYKNSGGKEWKKVLTVNCIKKIPKNNRKPVFFVASVSN